MILLVFDFPNTGVVAPSRFVFVKTRATAFEQGAALALFGPGPDVTDPSPVLRGWAWDNAAVQSFIPRY